MAEVKETKAKKVVINIEPTRYEKEPVWVGVNGKTYMIKRGEDVTVPAAVAEVLQNRRKMLAKLYELEDEASNKTAARELN